jgi:serine/threonine protein kinase
MERLGKYRIEEQLGRGAMGCVYKAWHPGFHDYVALKTILDTRLEGQVLLERFKRESQALAKLKHQNIVQIYDADQADGIHFIVMEYINGGSLDRIIDARTVTSMAKRVGYIIPVCHALNYAHRKGLFHRDIKPANIMLHHDGNEEIVKVVDFGIARLVDITQGTSFTMSETNLMIGAPAYMAPELFTGTGKADERSDIWALGVTLYELIAYQRPFQGGDLESLRQAVAHGKARPLRTFVAECPGELDDILQKMLEKEPSRRYQNVDELLTDLEPVTKRLSIETASMLFRRANDLFEMGDLDEAKNILLEASRYHPARSDIRELLQAIAQETKRRALLPRLHAHLKRSREFLQLEDFAGARKEIQAALGLDPQFEPAERLLEELEKAATRADLLHEKLRLTRQRLSEGALTQAESILQEAEELEGAKPEFADLRRQISEERTRQERRKRFNEIVARARSLAASADYDSCLELLDHGLREFPGDAELRKLQEIARADRAEADRQAERQREIESIGTLLSQEQFEEALEKASLLLRRFPSDTVVQNLKTLAADQFERERKGIRLADGVEKVRELLSQGNHELARNCLSPLLKEFPREAELLHLKDHIESASDREARQRAQIQRQKELDVALAELENLLRSGQLQEVISRSQKLLVSWPDESRVLRLRNSARELITEKERVRQISEGMQAVRKKIDGRRLAEAVAAAEKLTLRFPSEPDVQDILAEAVAALADQKRQELIQQKSREIQHNINKERYEEAIGQATEILVTYGANAQIESLRRAAEVELKEYQARIELEEKRLAESRALLADGKRDEALELVQDAIGTRLLKKSDQRVMDLLKDIRNWSPPSDPSPSFTRTALDKTSAPSVTEVSDPASFSSKEGGPNPTFEGERTWHPRVEWSIRVIEESFQNGRLAELRRAAMVMKDRFAFARTPVWLHEGRLQPKVVALAVSGLLLAGLTYLSYRNSQDARRDRERHAFEEAQSLEGKKQWPQALHEFQNIAGARGAWASRADEKALNLSKLINQENALLHEGEAAMNAGGIDIARVKFLEVVNLHGDLEGVAQSRIGELDRVVAPPPPNPRPEPKVSVKPPNPGTRCQLSASDIAVRLRRADSNLQLAEYETAEREYASVLACEPSNEHAKNGLDRAHRAKTTDFH